MAQEKGGGTLVHTLQTLFHRAYDRALNVFRYMSFGTSDGTDAVAMKTDADGHLQIDVLSTTGASATITNAVSATVVNNIKVSAIQNANSKVSVINNPVLGAGTNAVGKFSAIFNENSKVSVIQDVTLGAGTNAVGKFSAIFNENSKVSVINEPVLGAGTNAVGKVSAIQVASHAVSANINEISGFTSIIINHAASGSASVVAASAGKVITVYNIDMTVAASGYAAWKTSTTQLVGQQYFPKNSGKEQNYFPGFMCKTAAGSALYINTNAAITARGVIGITKL